MRNTFCNEKIFDELFFSNFNDLSNGLFECLNNLGTRKASFISCCDIIFNSDTYGDTKRKVDALQKACQLFDHGEEKETIMIVKELDSVDKKDKIDGQIVMYPINCMNKIEKAKHIEIRMCDLYSLTNTDYGRYLSTNILTFSSIKELYSNLKKERLNLEKSHPLKTVKRKILDKKVYYSVLNRYHGKSLEMVVREIQLHFSGNRKKWKKRKQNV